MCKHENENSCHCNAERLLRGAVIDSEYLFAERNEVQIRHNDQVYHLRVTKNGKLILNK